MYNKITFEGVWWMVTMLIVLGVLYPIYTSMGLDFPFYYQNVGLIVIAVTLLRFVFWLKHTWLGPFKWTKLVLFFGVIPVFIFVVDSFLKFNQFYDQTGFSGMLFHLEPQTALAVSKYIQIEFLFFCTAAFFSLIAFAIRMVVSLWRMKNKGYV